MNMKRRGKLVLSDELMSYRQQIPRLFYEIDFLPIEVFHDVKRSVWEYVGISGNFEEVPEGSDAPIYDFEALKTMV